MNANLSPLTIIHSIRLGCKKPKTLLKTDWKVLLSIDEFVASKINVSDLNKNLVYSMICRQLYGNIHTEIRSPDFTVRVARIHHGYNPIQNDGFVGGKRSLFKIPGQFWHTTMVRNPQALAIRWRELIGREMAEGDLGQERLLKYAKTAFDYHYYHEIWQNAYLVEVDANDLPEILRDNKKRFQWADFDKVRPLNGPFGYLLQVKLQADWLINQGIKRLKGVQL